MSTTSEPPVPAARAAAPRTLALLTAPIVPTLLRLAAPNVAVMVAQASTGLIETAFVGRLGTAALAGMAVVFPGFMLMQMMSAGAMGGAISATVARALGAGRRTDAEAVAAHAMAISAGFGLLFSVLGLLAGPTLYRAMGAEGAALDAALRYSNVVFGGALLVWCFNGLASCVRGTGNMALPAGVTCAGAVVLVPLSPCLIFGLGPFPALGVIGGGLALMGYYAAGCLVMGGLLLAGRLEVRLRPARFNRAMTGAILRVGLMSSLVSVQTNLIVVLTTALVAPMGAGAIAGYGTGARLEYLLVPLVFGLGAPSVAMVGTNLGAGQPARALRVAFASAALAGGMTGAIGVAAALFPTAWLRLFGTDPAMIEAGALYLRITGPFYGAFGVGMALYFASQGAGRMAWPLLGAVARTVVAVGGGWLGVRLTGQMWPAFLALGAGLLTLGAVNAAAVAGGAWFRPGLLPSRPRAG